MSDPKGFIKYKKTDLNRRPVVQRLGDWREFYNTLPEKELNQQAARCMDCGVPFCQSFTGCPVENQIPEWNDLVRRGRWKEALVTLHATNNFPEFTGKLCPAPCETACVLGINNSPVSIRMIESNIIERGFRDGSVGPIFPLRNTGKNVAVVGSGPAGLAAAQQLRRAGHQVVVFEKEDRIGGLLRYGIPDFKMEKWVLDRRLGQMLEEGVVFKASTEVGVNIKMKELRKQFDAICLTLGADQARGLNVPGSALKGIHNAMDFLVQQNRRNAGEIIPENELISTTGKRVVILGGGDTGSDCLGTVHRQGALEVHQCELLPQPPLTPSESTPWPLWPFQLRTTHAHEEGGKREWNILTTHFSGKEGSVDQLHAQRIEVKEGRIIPVPQSEFALTVDLVILALGFTGPRHSTALKNFKVQTDAHGKIQVNNHFMTNKEGIFAAGDAKRGASLIVWAIAEGRKMAAAVDVYLSTLK